MVANNDSSTSSSSSSSSNSSSSSSKDPSLTYGEVVVSSFLSILSFIDSYNSSINSNSGNSDSDRVFIDLGSGTGKAVYIAALTSNSGFNQCWGIELVPILLNDQFNTIIARLQSSSLPPPTTTTPPSSLKSKSKDVLAPNELITIIRQ